jgi:uridine phosphorylase
MDLLNHTFTRLHARITQEEGAFTVSIRLLNHLKQEEKAWGQETATSIDMASAMIDSIAEQFGIAQPCVSVSIVMANFRDGTFH